MSSSLDKLRDRILKTDTLILKYKEMEAELKLTQTEKVELQ